MKIRMLGLLIAVGLLSVIVGQKAEAATTGTTQGSFTLGEAVPSVTSLHIIPAAGGSPVEALTPGVSYKAQIVAGDANTIDDIDQIRIAIVLDPTDTDPQTDPGETGETKTLAVMKWVKSGDVWSISPSTSTTWSITAASCTKPSDMQQASGTWEFYFTVGKVATEAAGETNNAGWDLFGEVYDGTSYVEFWGDRDLAMEWYGEVTVNTTSVNFGTPVLGSGFADGTNEVNNISVKYLANGDYDEKISCQSQWTGSPSGAANFDDTGNCSSANQFSLKACRTDSFSSAIQVTTDGVFLDQTGVQTDESGNPVDTNTLWLKIASSFTQATYTGTITFSIGNRS